MPPKILIAESGSGYGGTAKYLAGLLAYLDPEKFAVHVAAYGGGPFIRALEQRGRIVYHRARWRFPWKENIFAGVLQLAFLVPSIAAWLRREKIALVHLNNEILSHLPLLLAAWAAGCKVICHLHGWRPFTRVEKWAVRYVDQFVAVSEAGAEYFREELKGRPVKAMPNGLSLNGELLDFDEKRIQKRKELGLRENEKAVAISGRLVPWKGHEVYLRSLARVMKNHPEVVGLVIGKDPLPGETYLARLRNLSDELGISPRVRFAGWQEDVWPFYAAADIVVHASTKPEPFGLVILEAMFAGRPVVATRGGGVADLIVHEKSGLLVEPDDAAAMAEAIELLLKDPAAAARLVEAAGQNARNFFTMERNAAQVAAVYEELLTKN